MDVRQSRYGFRLFVFWPVGVLLRGTADGKAALGYSRFQAHHGEHGMTIRKFALFREWRGDVLRVLWRPLLLIGMLALGSAGNASAQVGQDKAPSMPGRDGTPVAFSTVRRTHAQEGVITAAYLQKLYETTDKPNCGSEQRPAFLCSGVMLRATGSGVGYHVWDPNPANPKPGGVSFSWLRMDVQFRATTLPSGIVLTLSSDYGSYPYLRADVLCAFPMEAASDWRTEKGCGVEKNYADSGPCARQTPPVLTAAEWLRFFRRPNTPNPWEGQCSFNFARDTATNTAATFREFVEVRKQLQAQPDVGFPWYTEIIIAEWPAASEKTLPLAAFFYLKDNANGLARAKHYQDDLFATAGIWRPVIRLKLPVTMQDTATFTFAKADQSVP